MPGKLRHKRSEYPRLKREGFRMFVDQDLTLNQIAERLDVNPITVKRWSAKNRWMDRRKDALAARERREQRTLRHDLRKKLPEAVRRNLDITEELINRGHKVLTNKGKACEHCGRGEDTDSGRFNPSPKDLVALMNVELRILGAEGGLGGGGVNEVTPFPELNEHFVEEAGLLFAKYEGQLPDLNITEDGDVTTEEESDDE